MPRASTVSFAQLVEDEFKNQIGAADAVVALKQKVDAVQLRCDVPVESSVVTSLPDPLVSSLPSYPVDSCLPSFQQFDSTNQTSGDELVQHILRLDTQIEQKEKKLEHTRQEIDYKEQELKLWNSGRITAFSRSPLSPGLPVQDASASPAALPRVSASVEDCEELIMRSKALVTSSPVQTSQVGDFSMLSVNEDSKMSPQLKEKLLLDTSSSEASDNEEASPPPAQHSMDDAPKMRLLGGGRGGGTAPGSGDALYTRCLIVSVGLGNDALGESCIAEAHDFFCCSNNFSCGLGGDNCPVWGETGQFRSPDKSCGMSCKFMPVKASVYLPEKPFVVICGKEIL